MSLAYYPFGGMKDLVERILVDTPVIEKQAEPHGLEYTCECANSNGIHRALFREYLRNELIIVSGLYAVSWKS